MTEDLTRRKIIRNIGTLAGGLTAAIVLPERWTKPVIDTMITPAHAGYSGCFNGTLYTGSATYPNHPSCPTTSYTPPTTS